MQPTLRSGELDAQASAAVSCMVTRWRHRNVRCGNTLQASDNRALLQVRPIEHLLVQNSQLNVLLLFWDMHLHYRSFTGLLLLGAIFKGLETKAESA